MFLGATKVKKAPPVVAPPAAEPPELPVVTKPAPVPTSAKRLAVYIAVSVVAVAILWVSLTRKRDE